MLIALVGLIGSGKDTVGRHLVEQHGFQDIAFAGALKDALCAIFGWDREMIEGKTPQSRAWRDQVDHWWAEKLGIPHFTPRWAMQNVGTETLREHFHDKLWIFRVEREIRRIAEDHSDHLLRCVHSAAERGEKTDLRTVPQSSIVITDGRFPNELDMVRSRGGRVIRVRRGDEPEWFTDAVIANTQTGPDAHYAKRKFLVPGNEWSGVHVSEWAWAGYGFDAVIENDGSLDQLFECADRIISKGI